MFVIKNAKISIKINEISLNSVIECLDKNNIVYKIKSNYIIIESKYVFVIFKPKNCMIVHINVTKIGSLSDINKVADVLIHEILSNLQIVVNKIVVDNITAVYQTDKIINIPKIIESKKDCFKISYNNEKFPGMFIKFSVGTLIIFYTGKIIAVGCKTESNLEYLFDQLNKLI